MSSSVPCVVLLYVLLLFLRQNYGIRSPNTRCNEAERQALLRIKEQLYVYSFRTESDTEVGIDLLSSWGEEEEKRECCEWIGIGCSNNSGHVIKLDLSPSTLSFQTYDYVLRGKVSSSLFDLKYLNHLDLSNVEFAGEYFPTFIGGLTRLRYLNLSSTALTGDIPPQLGNLSSLQFLDLSTNNLESKNLNWVLHLSSLRVLDLSGTNMSLVNDWVHVVDYLSHFITNLVLSSCELPDIVSPSFANSSKALRVLDLSRNYPLSESIFQWLFNYKSSLVHLDLSGCGLPGSIPSGFKNMAALTYLDLSWNDFEGIIPESFGDMVSLTYLDLAENQLKGFNPHSFKNTTAIAYLDLSYNQLKGSIPESFGNMISLTYLDLHGNQLNFLNPKSFENMTAIKYLNLESNHLKGSIPENFGNMQSLAQVNLSNNELEGQIPKSIWKICELVRFEAYNNSLGGELHFSESSSNNSCANFPMEYLDLKQNRIMGSLPNFTLYPSLVELHLSSNLFSGISQSIGQLSKLEIMDFSENKIEDYTPDWLWNFRSDLSLLDLSNNQIRGRLYDIKQSVNFSYEYRRRYPDVDLSSNQLEGSVPSFLLQVTASLNLFNNRFSQLNSICEAIELIPLIFLDVSYNQLSGEIPDCWSQARSLRILVLANNKLSGKIPISIGFLVSINVLHLRNNNLTAELPSSLKNCTQLVIFDVGGNKLSGEIPTWIGTSLTGLLILSTRSNSFNGSIPLQLCHLVDLQFLDLSSNDMSSRIPNCLSNITAMKELNRIEEASYGADPYSETRGQQGVPDDFNREKLVLMWKGTISEFKNVGLLKSIDLSSNKLIGEIPKDISKLVGLIALNLSKNNLSGHIPQEIGQLKSLDVLDLSKNHFLGHIPSTLTQVDRLGVLDLSNNNLSGEIPRSTQLQSRDAASYMGNPLLCGVPLPIKCPNGKVVTTSDEAIENHGDDGFISKGFYISLALGFVVGFWVFCGTLIFNKSWRCVYLKLLNNVGDWAYVTSEVGKKKLLQMFRS
uniref:Leucine-rich repeat-containing N-terminal plant-type domain-containing protein n=1 Tax=Cannabis sativa TaxID=3483 RepID=A0A803P2W6_CANSA